METTRIVSRDGPLVQVRDRFGKLWLTKRVTRMKDDRRRFYKQGGKKVRHMPIHRIVEHGDWIFTCKLEPLQFNAWDKEKDPKHYNRASFTDKEWEQFSKWDDFTTIEGSHHSKTHCSLKPISDAYAEFFIRHKLWELFDIHYKDFELYEQAVKKVCEVYKITYEGI